MRIGIDLGGTKTEAIALDRSGGVLERLRVPTPSGGYEAIVRCVADLVAELERRTGQAGKVGVGTPGAISPASGLIKNSNTVALNGRPLHGDLERALGRSVRIANDADCFALSEAVDGAGAGAHCVFGVILGTGTGAGIVVGGRLLQGPNAIAGEWGHNPMPWPSPDETSGRACYCGRSGCIETFLSGPGLAEDYRGTIGEVLSAKEVAERAAAGQQAAEVVLARYQERLAKALASVINLLDPDVIVLGGGLANIAALYTSVPWLWGRYVFSDQVDTRLLPAVHGDASGVRGAAWLWQEQE
jgi:fructokinase